MSKDKTAASMHSPIDLAHKNQQKASNPSRSVWVSANAGTGKTKVLVDRYIRILLEGIPPESIICITFTRAAAAEMKERILKRLSDWTITDTEKLEDELRKLLGTEDVPVTKARRLFIEMADKIHQLNIQTIHSFCQNILRQFPFEAEIEPHFALAEDQEISRLMQQARREVVANCNQTENKWIAEAISTLARYFQEGFLGELLEEMIIQNRDKMLGLFHNSSLETVLDVMPAIFEINPDVTLGVLEHEFCQDVALLGQIVQRLQKGKQRELKLAERIREWLEKDLLARKKDITQVFDIFLDSKNEYEAKRIAITKELSIQDSALEIVLGEEAQRIREFRDKWSSYALCQVSRSLVILAHAVHEAYFSSKRKMAILDYSDLIALTNAVLNKKEIAPWILYKLDQRWSHLMLDEAQDTSRDQWEVVLQILENFLAEGDKTEKSLFVVGDDKQSIYRFQGADVGIYQIVKDSLMDRFDEKLSNFEVVDLGVSFRSFKPILDLVDQVLLQPELSEMSATTPIPHISSRGESGIVEVRPLLQIESQEDETVEGWSLPITRTNKFSPPICLAKYWADQIDLWIRSGRRLADGQCIRPQDILILVRKRTAFISAFVSECKKRGIPVSGLDRINLQANLVVKDLIAYAELMLFPEDNLTLATVLKGPFIGLSEMQLFSIASPRGTESLFKYMESSTDPEIVAIYKRLHEDIMDAKLQSPLEFFTKLLDYRQGRKSCAEKLGHEVLEIIEAFLQLCIQSESQEQQSLESFVDWIKQENLVIKRELEQGAEEVRIMTVHAAKGLQAKVVIIPDAASYTQKSSAILWLGNAIKIPLWARKKELANTLIHELKKQEKRLDHFESMRLLYVALTRAESELYIGGIKGRKENKEASWYDIITRAVRELPATAEEDGILRYGQKEEDLCSGGQWVEDAKTSDSYCVPATFSREVFSCSNTCEGSSEYKSSSDKQAYIGVFIHRLLQELPKVSEIEAESVVRRWAQIVAPKLSLRQQNACWQEARGVITSPQFQEFFARPSLTEVPLAGYVDGSYFSARIDRVVDLGDRWLIIDYKTTRTPPLPLEGIPQDYINQLAIYKKLFEAAVSPKPVRSAILWTANLQITMV